MSSKTEYILRRVVQSLFGGVATFALLIAWMTIVAALNGPEWLGSVFFYVILTPSFFFAVVFPHGSEDLFGSILGWFFGFLFNLYLYSLLTFIVIELNDKDSALRMAIRRAVTKVTGRYQLRILSRPE